MNIPTNWTFENSEVAAAFDNHVREQLPWYELTTGIVSHIARHYIPQNGVVYDIGASTGNIGKSILETLQNRNASFYAIESSAEMAELYCGPGTLINKDAAEVDYERCDFVICFLVLMFIKTSKRSALIQKIMNALNPGGAFVLVDKCAPVAGYPSVVMQRLALAGKVAAGVSAYEIIAKEMSLGGVQRPLEKDELPENAIEVFRFGDFAGWLIEKK
jgi:tRNA (cmo5U34)-methyltransferase